MQQVPVIAVPPKYITQQCLGCGTLVRKSLSVRTHVCPHCGLMLDRDHHAALVIREAGLAQTTQQGVWDPVGQRVLHLGTVGHTATGTLGDSRAPTGRCAAARCPGWRNQASPGCSRAECQAVPFLRSQHWNAEGQR